MNQVDYFSTVTGKYFVPYAFLPKSDPSRRFSNTRDFPLGIVDFYFLYIARSQRINQILSIRIVSFTEMSLSLIPCENDSLEKV